ncbi:hypothetical protein CDD80_754 [Ophiocordyceps camponoti-rufipedis]|uniref:Uncharacterized protein n=1 Tax=Ophiocordyceps camponoti-rufipedis TaxID=2004952 RepID=A0A2C5ZC21_9HYPO|nr:hypothetical protein CDD80_754 [Ophiocordyceps camponoti-rufipedis]
MPSSDGGHQPPYAMVFVARGSQSAAFNCHFPKMVGVACKDCPPDERTRLVGFSKPCSDRLSSCLGIARVSSVALRRDAPGAAALWDLVRRKVAPIDMAWLDDAVGAEHRATKADSIILWFLVRQPDSPYQRPAGSWHVPRQQKMAAARELAQSFKAIKDKAGRRNAVKDKSAHGSYQAGYQGNVYEITPQPRIPLPSQRHYDGLGRFGMPPEPKTNQKPLLGNSLDFLRRVEAPAPATENPTPATVENPMKQAAALPAPKASSMVFLAKPKVLPKGSIQEAFYALVADGNESPKTKSGMKEPVNLMDIEDGDDTANGSKLQKFTPISPTVATSGTASPSPTWKEGAANPKPVSETKPEAEVAEPKVAGPKLGTTITSPVQSKASTLNPVATSFLPTPGPSPAKELAEEPLQANNVKRNKGGLSASIWA